MEEVKRCACCGTTGGLVPRGGRRPVRSRGMCHACYMRDYYRRTKGKAPYRPPEVWTKMKAWHAHARARRKLRELLDGKVGVE